MTDRQWCCMDQDIMNSDHQPGDEAKVINRVCLSCYTHFYGKLGAVKKYTRKQWDQFIDRNLKNLEKEIFQ